MCLCLFNLIVNACTRDDKKNGWDIHWEKSKTVPDQPPFIPKKSSVQPIEKKVTRQKIVPPQKKAIKAPYLIQTKWHQHFPFNKALPMIDGNRVVVGCVNIAIAQLLYYHKHPIHGHGIVHHQWQNQTFTAIMDRRFYWNKMPLMITPETPNYSIDELAALIRDISMINQTQFGLGPHEQSGAAFDMSRFITHFGFSSDIHQTLSQDPNFFDIIDQELNAKRPVLISIKGKPIDHMAIVDGKIRRHGTTLYHINMGWGGQHNQFYDLKRPIVLESIANQQSIGQTYRFSNQLTLYAPIKPCKGQTCTPNNLEKNDMISGNKIRGLFDNNTDEDRYENIVLKGVTIIQGDRGYANQAFYINLYDRFHQLMGSFAPETKAIKYDFDPGIYHISASLCQNNARSIHCYELTPDHTQYHIQINTEVMSDDEQMNIFSDIGPPVFQSQLSDIILPRNFNKHIIRIDTYHPMGLPVELSVESDTYRTGIHTRMDDHFLVISNRSPQHNNSVQILVTAETNGLKTQADFNLMFSGKRVWFGKVVDIPGKFTFQDCQNVHRIILESNCRLTGFNGFMNQAFYFAVYDKSGRMVVPPTDQPIEQYFDRGIYQIRTALKIEYREETRLNKTISTNYYQYQQGMGDQYVIHAYCPYFTHDMNLLFQDNEDAPPVFQNDFNPIVISNHSKAFSIPVNVIDPDGDEISLSAGSDHPDIEVRIKDKSLNIIPHSPDIKTTAMIVVSATANQKQTNKEFTLFVAQHNISMGKKFELTGMFVNQDDTHLHPVILSGECRISGFNGFKNQAFFHEVIDKNKKNVMPASNHELMHFFNGFYYIKTSLSGNAKYFPYIKDKSDQYTIKISCPDADLDERFIESILMSVDY